MRKLKLLGALLAVIAVVASSTASPALAWHRVECDWYQGEDEDEWEYWCWRPGWGWELVYTWEADDDDWFDG